MNEFNRRNFIRTTGLVIGGVPFFSSCISNPSSYRFFTEDEATCILAFCEQIIPRDEDPGASDAGVIYYIDRQLSGAFRNEQGIYRDGIRKLQGYCDHNYRKPFQDIEHSEQIRVMEKMESGGIRAGEWPGGSPGRFFNTARLHTMQGFYGSPIHGGNKDYMSFRMLDFEYPLVIGRNKHGTPKQGK